MTTNRVGRFSKLPPQELGSNLGPFAAENRRTRGKTTQSQPKRDNKLANPFLVRNQGVGGSNPLSPTILFNQLSVDVTVLFSGIEPYSLDDDVSAH